MRASITDKTVKLLKPAAEPYEVRDDGVSGWLLRVQPSGVMTHYFEYRKAAGADAEGRTIWRKRRVKIGRVGALGVPEARKKAVAMAASVALGGDPAEERKPVAPEPEAAPMTLREFVSGPYADYCRSSHKSAAVTLCRLPNAFSDLMDKPLDELTTFDFERNRQARLKAVKGSTVARDTAGMRAALQWGVRQGMLAFNPVADVTRTRTDRNLQLRPITAHEEALLLDALKARRDAAVAAWQKSARKVGGAPPIPRFLTPLEPAFIVAIDTGVRRGEMLCLLWSDVNFSTREITIRGEVAKSGQSRIIPMTNRVQFTLAAWGRQQKNAGHVFAGLTENNLRHAWLMLLKEAGVEHRRWHDLRHTFGTRAALAGVPVDTLRRLMGHADLNVTMRYLHSSKEDARRGVDLLEASMAQPANIVDLEAAK